MDRKIRDALKQAAGKAYFSDVPLQRVLYACDASGLNFPPQAVIRAKNQAQVAAVLAACTRYRVPIVPRGAGTGLTGGALAVDGGVVLDMSGMNRIVRIDPADHVAVVQPGVITADLQNAASRQGLF